MPNRTTRLFTTTLLAGALLLAGAGSAAAEDPEEQGSGEQDSAAEPTEAGTTFRTATALEQERHASAAAAVGDYLYWVVPVGAGQDATAEATVTLPDSGSRSGPSTWQLDLYDGLRRRQACVAGEATAVAEREAESVTLSCTLRTVRPWAEPWADDPLPGAYYVRLTSVELAEEDLGLPLRAEVMVTAAPAGGARAAGGELAAPLVPTSRAGSLETGAGTATDADAGTEDDADGEAAAGALSAPEGGWTDGWWSDRWLWTAAGGILASLAAIGGYSLTRRRT
ncbi:hypothetical protein PJ985_13425 [Streptomyces sp. ACA25]|uniref:hypothetical protein n=1 Tax=Streptomyces sp. ACA25 TaxID=3022596 RepID=UPI002307594B|nr:hypothetical protein [Streptomyces sp. ACA25]MDB1088569.1 hypothetical protein [Streptomyces sp. ACA25]